MKSLLQKLRNQEISAAGQLALSDERKADPSWKKSLTEYLEEIRGTGMHSHSKASANVAVADVVPHAARNKRKRTTAPPPPSIATTKHCINHPNSTTHDTSECRIGGATTPSAKKAKASDAKTKPKYTGPPCTWCLSQPKYRERAAPTHSVDNCKLKGKSNQHSANNTTVTDSEQKQLMTTMNKLVSRFDTAFSQPQSE